MTAEGPVLLSIGSLIIDDIRFEDGSEEKEVLGGGGVHTVYGKLSSICFTCVVDNDPDAHIVCFSKGMRLWYPPPRSKLIGFHAQKGFDFPPAIHAQLHSLDISLSEKLHPTTHSPRAWNIFGSHDHRDFEYQHPNIRTTPADFPPEWILSTRVVHYICTPNRAASIVTEWDALKRRYASERNIEWGKLSRTVHLWEPLPPSAAPENWEACREIMKQIDVVTPNHEEAAGFLGRSMDWFEDADDKAAERELNELADAFLESGVGEEGKGCIVIRAGKRGCLVATRKQRQMIPAYWQVSEEERGRGVSKPENVRDVTGAGNAFCGGFAAGLVESGCGDVVEAAMYGTVSASFTVEQVGTPRLVARAGDDGTVDGRRHVTDEKWNDGPTPGARLDELRRRLKV